MPDTDLETADAAPSAGRPQTGTGHRLVIVESPAKAKTIAGYLGPGYVVESLDRAHPRPAAQRRRRAGQPVRARPGPSSASTSTTASSRSTSSAPTRSSRSPSSRRCSRTPTSSSSPPMRTARARPSPGTCSRPSSPRSRCAGWCSTRSRPPAIQDAVETPRELDRPLVDAQETRRILDRLYGYEVSPVLWKKVMPRLSAGRVQSVATRIVVERERARMRFVEASYWDIEGTFTAPEQDDPTAADADGDARAARRQAARDRSRLRPRLRSAARRRRARRRGKRALARRAARRRAVRRALGRGQALHAASPTRRS